MLLSCLLFVSALVKPSYGISVAASVRVGNELGAGQHIRAKRAAYLSMGLVGKWVLLRAKPPLQCAQYCLCICLVCSGVLGFLLVQSMQSVIGRIFTSNKYVQLIVCGQKTIIL